MRRQKFMLLTPLSHSEASGSCWNGPGTLVADIKWATQWENHVLRELIVSFSRLSKTKYARDNLLPAQSRCGVLETIKTNCLHLENDSKVFLVRIKWKGDGGACVCVCVYVSFAGKMHQFCEIEKGYTFYHGRLLGLIVAVFANWRVKWKFLLQLVYEWMNVIT